MVRPLNATPRNRIRSPIPEESLLRTDEKNKIKQFLTSSCNVLHISGNPGTGKTMTVKYVLKNEKYTYINYMVDQKFFVRYKIVVFDEFDRFYLAKKKECLTFLLKHKNKKIITISNNMLFDCELLIFRPYTKNEILYIVTKKLNCERISNDVIEYISLREKNDLRKIMCACNELLLKNSSTITFKDIAVKKKRKESIHQQIIHELKKNFRIKEEAFKNYLTRCKELNVDSLSRPDFTSVYENFE